MSADERLITLLAGVLLAMLGPWVAERLRLIREARKGDADVEIRKYSHTENLFDRYVGEIERLTAEVGALNKRMRVLELRDGEVRAVLYGLLGDIHEQRDMLAHSQHPRTEELSLKSVQMEKRVRETMKLWESEVA